MATRQTILSSIYSVSLFSGFGLICIFGFWPWLKDIGFLVAGVLLNVLAFAIWFKLVRKRDSLSK